MATAKPFNSALLLDDAGRAVGGNWLDRQIAGERLIQGRKQTLYDEQTKRNHAGGPIIRVVNPNTHLNPTPGGADGFHGILAMQENAAQAQGRTLNVKPTLQALSRASLAGGSTRMPIQPRQEAAMPQAPRASVPMDEETIAANEGSGAGVALARKRKELGLAALESALMRQRLADADPDGSQAATVALGRERHAREWDETIGNPRAQASANAVGALAGAAKRDEWQKNWEAQAPQRRFEGEQYERRYVEPAAMRRDMGMGVAETNADARRDVAETTGQSRVEAEQMKALARAVQEMLKQGQAPDAQAYGETGGVLPESNISQRLSRLQASRPGLAPENYINLLGEITDDEYEEAMRLLGGGA